MGVDACNIDNDFVELVNDAYNQEVYFVESCKRFPSKYAADIALMDSHLQVFFEKNNFIVINGKCVKYCSEDGRKKIKLANISIESQDFVINNFVVEDNTWTQTDW